MASTLIEAQKTLEDNTVTSGITRYQERLKRKLKGQGQDAHPEVQKLIRGAIPILSAGIKAWVEQALQAKGRKATSLSALEAIDPDVVALIGNTAIFSELRRGGRTSNICASIGESIRIELEAIALEAKDPKVAARIQKMAEKGLSSSFLEHVHNDATSEHEVSLGWSVNTRVLVGQTVLNVALVELKDLFIAKTIADGGKTHAVVQITDEAAAALSQMEDAAALGQLPLKPMVSQPRRWEHMTSGAYYDYRLSKLVPMVRTRSKEHKKLIKEAIENGEMDEVLEALNAIQDTRFAIDTRVLHWVRWVKENELRTCSSFPASFMPELPPKAEPEVWESMSKEERQARSRKRKSIALMRQAIGVDKAVFTSDLDVADYLADFDAFYMPHSLDFRGRTYAVPYFNHQRSDHLKALFRFADSVPLGKDGGDWLMIHLANCGDFGKVSKAVFEDRIAWVRDNEEAILDVAEDPEATFAWWSQADSPFCFLQACFEYAEWVNSDYSPDFRSTISGAADGSCSGLQHYSAITRSEKEAYHVNLVPRDSVGDIYSVTAGEALPMLQETAKRMDEDSMVHARAAQIVLENGFGRGEVKRNVMTYFYGSAKFGMRDQHMMDLMRPLSDKVAMGELEEHPYQMLTERKNKETGEITQAWDGGFTCANVMAGHVYAAVTTVAAKADEAASWIQQVAAILAHESLSMIWRTQTGFPVVQRYSEYTSKRVNLWLYDRSVTVPTSSDKVDEEGNVLARVQVLLRQAPTSRVDKKTMRSASSPNVIHSMDAAHLHKAVALAKALGIDNFMMIHDSFGTHLGNMAVFGKIIREAFVQCYEEYCPLAELDRYARSVLSEEGIEKLPPIPEKGNLDLNLILEAKYAFA